MEREREVVYCRFRQPSRSTSIKVSYRVWRRRTRRRFVSFRSFVHSFIHSSQCRVDFGFYWLLAASWVLIVFWNRFFRRQSISTFARIAYVFRWISQIGIDFLWIEFRPRSLSCVPFSTLWHDRFLDTFSFFLALWIFGSFYWVFLSFTEFSWVLPSFTDFSWVLPSFLGFSFVGLYLVLPSFTKWNLYLLSFLWFYRVFLVSCRILTGFFLGFAEFCWALPKFTEFFWFLPCLTEFYSV